MKPYHLGSTTELPFQAKLMYGWADLYGGGALNLVGFYYLIFLTDVVNINPAWAGLVIMISKIWDGISDPLMGILTDRTRTRFGRRRPYFMFNIVGVIISMLLLWYAPAYSLELSRFLFALFGYLFFSTTSTILMVPYLSLMPSLAKDYNQRTSLNAYKMAFSFFAGIFAAVLPMQIVRSVPDIRQGYLIMAGIFGVFYAIPWVFMSWYFREQDNRSEKVEGSLFSQFRLSVFLAPLKIRAFRYVIGIYLGAFLVMDLMSALIAYFMTYVLKRPADLQVVLGILIIFQLLSMPVVLAISKKIGKKYTAILCSLVWLLSVGFIALSPAEWPYYIIYIQAAITGFGVCGALVMPWSMYPDAADVGFVAQGKDCAGSFSGVMTFFRKLASAIALFIVGVVLEFSGYTRPESLGVEVLEQPQSAQLAIRLLLTFAPLVLLGMVIFLAAKMPLTKELYELVRKRVDFLQGKTSIDVTDDEFAQIQRTLI